MPGELVQDDLASLGPECTRIGAERIDARAVGELYDERLDIIFRIDHYLAQAPRRHVVDLGPLLAVNNKLARRALVSRGKPDGGPEFFYAAAHIFVALGIGRPDPPGLVPDRLEGVVKDPFPLIGQEIFSLLGALYDRVFFYRHCSPRIASTISATFSGFTPAARAPFTFSAFALACSNACAFNSSALSNCLSLSLITPSRSFCTPSFSLSSSTLFSPCARYPSSTGSAPSSCLAVSTWATVRRCLTNSSRSAVGFSLRAPSMASAWRRASIKGRSSDSQ